MANNPSDVGLALSLRMPPAHVSAYFDVESGKAKAQVARDLGLSKQRVHQIHQRALALLAARRTPSREISAALAPIESEACAQAGLRSMKAVREALIGNRIPKWWPAPVTVALCKRLGVPVPGRAAAKVAELLMKLQAVHTTQGRLISEAHQALDRLHGEEP